MGLVDVRSSARKILICQVIVEAHRTVEDRNDLKRLPFDGEENDVLLVSDGAAAFCQAFTQSAGFRAARYVGEFCPKAYQTPIFLFGTPSHQRV